MDSLIHVGLLYSYRIVYSPWLDPHLQCVHRTIRNWMLLSKLELGYRNRNVRDRIDWPRTKSIGQWGIDVKTYTSGGSKAIAVYGAVSNCSTSAYKQQEAQLPQRNSASAVYVYLGWLTDRAMHRTPQNHRGCIIFWHSNALIQDVLTENGFWRQIATQNHWFCNQLLADKG